MSRFSGFKALKPFKGRVRMTGRVGGDLEINIAIVYHSGRQLCPEILS